MKSNALALEYQRDYGTARQGQVPETKPLKPKEPGMGTGNKKSDGDLHPFIRGLLQALPPPHTKWSYKKREQWLDTARNIFRLIYEDIETN